MSPLTFLHLCGLLTHPEAWDAHCDVFASCTIKLLQVLVYLQVSWEHQQSSWVAAELGNILLEWPGEAEAGEMEMDITGPCWQL